MPSSETPKGDPHLLNYALPPEKHRAPTPLTALTSVVLGSVSSFFGAFCLADREFDRKGFWVLPPLAVAGIGIGIWSWRHTRNVAAPIGTALSILGAIALFVARLRV